MYDQKGLPDRIRNTLISREPELIQDPPAHFRHAGVLIPLFYEDGEHKVLFTKRTHHVLHHKGQISFPGGSVDTEDESPEGAALRESYEEIGLLKQDVEVLGQIDDHFTMASNFIIHPFVGLIPSPYDFNISEIEVKRLIKIPWNALVMDSLRNNTSIVESEGKFFETPVYKYNGDLIWGATAKMLKNFIDILNRK